jgi:hypothetical protein
MTTFAPTFTPRWKGKYIVAGLQHTIQIRGPRGASFSTMDGMKDRARELFDAAHGDLCSDFGWIEASVALTDSDVFLPATTPTVGTPGGNSISDYSPISKISAMTVSGKAADGRARFSMYGLLFLGSTPGDIGADGLVRASEFAALTSIVTTANTYFYANSGLLAKFHSVATYKPNDHLLKLVRRGTIT